jgi:hypothetical protein
MGRCGIVPLTRTHKHEPTTMPAEFVALKCSSCHKFQSKQYPKVPKWSCVVCGQKQSIITVYSRSSSARDIREVVQAMNAKQGEGTLFKSAQHMHLLTMLAMVEELARDKAVKDMAVGIGGLSAVDEIDGSSASVSYQPMITHKKEHSLWDQYLSASEDEDPAEEEEAAGSTPVTLSGSLSDVYIFSGNSNRKRKHAKATTREQKIEKISRPNVPMTASEPIFPTGVTQHPAESPLGVIPFQNPKTWISSEKATLPTVNLPSSSSGRNDPSLQPKIQNERQASVGKTGVAGSMWSAYLSEESDSDSEDE